jgi:hypothetical protein
LLPLIHFDLAVAQLQRELAACRANGDFATPAPDIELDERGGDCDRDMPAGRDLLLRCEEADAW